MRTTVTPAEDVAGDRVRPPTTASASLPQDETHDLGAGVDYSNVAEAIESLDGPAAR